MCAYREVDFHECAFTDDNFHIYAFTEGFIYGIRLP
jgi:hypothetical protein